MKSIFSEEEIEIIRKNYPSISAKGCSLLIQGKTCPQIRNVARRLGLAKAPPPHGRERFESKFRVTPGCWIWLEGKNQKGYGQYWDGKRNGKAHRFSYELYIGPVPDDLYVCHRCDNPSCVNPNHFFLGTTQDNTADRVKKGRNARLLGAEQSSAKLTPKQVLEIRRASGTTIEIGERYGISDSSVSRIKTRKLWAHLEDEAEAA